MYPSATLIVASAQVDKTIPALSPPFEAVIVTFVPVNVVFGPILPVIVAMVSDCSDVSALATMSEPPKKPPRSAFAGTEQAITSTARAPAMTRFKGFLIVIIIPPKFFYKTKSTPKGKTCPKG